MIQVKQKDLKAVSLAMAKQDIRYYLKGVFVEFNGVETRVTATDGHRLHIIRALNENGTMQAPVSFIVPTDMVKHCLKAKAPRKVEALVSFSFSPDSQEIEAFLPDNTTLKTKALEGQYPDYRRIVQRVYDSPEETKLAVYNHNYLYEASEALSIYLRGNRPMIGLRHRGDSVGVLEFGEFLALVMPLRGDISLLPERAFTEPLQAPEPLQSPEPLRVVA
jgi:hypothetical protein